MELVAEDFHDQLHRDAHGHTLRAFAWSQPTADLSAVVKQLDQLDEAVMHIVEASKVTMLLGRIWRGDADLWHLRWTNAGHPPPLLIPHNGQARYLDDAHGVLLDTGAGRPHPGTVTVLPPRLASPIPPPQQGVAEE
ncbi:SpoIIE family protein phosphatase [Streptomyces sp. NPDC021139]|uniref:SpoIIE family protein phosphatase n=1 Tax=Streptomyces sp. NPDC021139 TaxID=3154899 RepID=UPI0033F7FE37